MWYIIRILILDSLTRILNCYLDYQICEYLKDGSWQVKRDDGQNFYAVNKDQWVGFDGIPAVARKVTFTMLNIRIQYMT